MKMKNKTCISENIIPTTLITLFFAVYSFAYLERYSGSDFSNGIYSGSAAAQGGGAALTAVFLLYAAGNIVNGGAAERLGGRISVIIGAGSSFVMSVMTMLLITDGTAASQAGAVALWILRAINGYMQSFLWLGGVLMIKEFFGEKSRGIGIGVINSASGAAHILTFAAPQLILTASPAAAALIAAALTVFTAVYGAARRQRAGSAKPDRSSREKPHSPYAATPAYILSKNDQAHAQAKANAMKMPNNEQENAHYDPDLTISAARQPKEKAHQSAPADRASITKDRNFLMWCAIAFLSSLCRYGLLKWISVYYGSALREAISADSAAETVLAAGMGTGTLVICIITEKYFRENRALTAAASAALCAMLIAVFPSQTELATIMTGIFFTGFFLYGINGILWLTALDSAATGKAAGVFNGCAYIGAAAQEMISQTVLAGTDNGILVFLIMELVCIIMTALSVFICRKNTIILASEKTPQNR